MSGKENDDLPEPRCRGLADDRLSER